MKKFVFPGKFPGLIGAIILILGCLTFTCKAASPESDCWWTGCHKSSWSVVGCDQYNRTVRQSKPCEDGKEYQCCANNDLLAKSIQAVVAEPGCWWTGCQSDSWAVVGCDQYNLTSQQTKPCEGGKEYQCCPKKETTTTTSTTTIKPEIVDCWWTGCQKNDWANVGCAIYNRTEKERRDCDNGHEYNCCTGLPDKVPVIDKQRQCWWSSCQLKSTPKRGCPDDLDFKSSEPCPDGDLFECCEKEDRPQENEIEPISGGTFDSFVKYLLLKSRNFTIEPSNLKCTHLDPDKSIIMQVGENDGIRMCDLCPSFPLLYLPDIFLDRIPSNTTFNADFQSCFGSCESNARCLAFSYDLETFTCYMFNSTVGIFTVDANWKTVLMTQPSGILESWLYLRHTAISGEFYKIDNTQKSFRDCLKACQVDNRCNHVSYNLQSFECKMYSNVSAIDYIDMNYGWLTAFNVTDLPSDDSDVSWRFSREENDLNQLASSNNKPTNNQNTCSSQRNLTHSAFFSKECFTSGAIGCDSSSGCKTCYYPESTEGLFTGTYEICPDSIMQKSFRLADQVTQRMAGCLNNLKCLGVGVNGEEEYAEEILAETLAKDYQTRYMLRYPKINNGLHQFLLKNDLFSDYDIVSNGRITQYYKEMTRESVEDCLKEMNKNDQITKISYSLITKKCKVTSNQVSAIYNPGQGLISMVKHPDISSHSVYYKAIYGVTFDGSKSKSKMQNCLANCEESCASRCKNELKDWCGYYTVSYRREGAECLFYEDDDSLKISSSNTTIIYKRMSTTEFNLNSLNQLSLFQSEDIYGCFRGGSDQDASTKSQSSRVKRGDIALRSRRGLFDKIGNFFKKVGKGIVDTVKKTVNTIIDTGKGVVKTVGNLVKGDLKGAKDSFMKIPVVNDVKNVVELGGAVIKGDWDKAKEKGADLLQSSTLDLVTSVIPGGKIAGKLASTAGKALANTGKAAKNGVKSTVNKLDTKDKKVKDRKGDRDKDNDGKDKDKNKDNEQRGSQCEARRPKRASDNKRKKPGDDCSDDDDDGTGSCIRPRDPKIIDATTSDCRNRKSGGKCDFECEPGYDENDPEVVCKDLGKNKFSWTPVPKCILKTCPNGNDILISLETPKTKLGAIGTSKHVVVYSVLYDKRRELPSWSIALHQSDNFQSASYNELFAKNRENDFEKYPCTALATSQGDANSYAGTGWDRGHLTPANVARWSPKATLSTNLYINVAPQDRRTNQGAWRTLEAHVQCFGKRKRMLVATGVCSNSIGKTQTLSGLDVPSCFWKMLCYKDEQSNEVVVGFISDNSKVNSDAQYNSRKQQVFTPVDQKDIRRLITGVPLQYNSPWLATAMELNKGREIGVGADSSVWLPVSPVACERALEASTAEKDGWIASFAKANDAELDRGKNPRPKPKKKKRQASQVLDRGCHPDELKSMLALLGLATMGAGVGENGESIIENDGADNGDGSVKVNVGSCGKRIIGYYSSWGKKPITGTMMQRLTHVVYAFLEMSADGSVHIGSPDRKNSANADEETEKSKSRLEHLMSLRRLYPHVKILFAVGGWENSQYFSAMAASSSMKNTFMTSIVKLIEQWGFDGVDIDWEYPVTGGAQEGVPADKQNYVSLMRDLRGLLDSLASEAGRSDKYLISFAGAAGQWTLDPGFDLPGLLKYADFANIMTYDFFGAWASKWGAYTGPPAPLYFGMPPRFSGKTNTAWTVKYYTCKSQLPHKLNMGVPFYGRYWKNVGDPVDGSDGMWRTASAVNGKFEGDFVPWNKIESEYTSNPAYTVTFHEKSKTPYAWNPSAKIFLGFENPQSLEHKVKYAVEKNVGGLMIWAIDLDDDQLTLLDVVSKAPLCTNTDPKKVEHVCSPIDEKRWWTSEDGSDKEGLCGKSAPLYKGYYPVCDPDDPGYACCGKFGYCGTGSDFCDCPSCKDYGKDPRKILEGAIKPSVPITWYLLNDPDGKRGRCGRKIPKINGVYPTCNPDDDNSHCCSNGGYCGATPGHCTCSGCIDFRKDPNYKFGPKKWWTLEDGKDLGGQCGPKAPKVDGIYEAECEPESQGHYCCSPLGWCGSGPDFCDCDGCKNFKKK